MKPLFVFIALAMVASITTAAQRKHPRLLISAEARKCVCIARLGWLPELSKVATGHEVAIAARMKLGRSRRYIRVDSWTSWPVSIVCELDAWLAAKTIVVDVRQVGEDHGPNQMQLPFIVDSASDSQSNSSTACCVLRDFSATECRLGVVAVVDAAT